MKRTLRFLSWLVMITLCFSMLQAGVLADESLVENTESEQNVEDEISNEESLSDEEDDSLNVALNDEEQPLEKEPAADENSTDIIEDDSEEAITESSSTDAEPTESYNSDDNVDDINDTADEEPNLSAENAITPEGSIVQCMKAVIDSHPNGTFTTGASPCLGESHILVIDVVISGEPNELSKQDVEDMLFGDYTEGWTLPGGRDENLTDYFRSVSYGKLEVTGTVKQVEVTEMSEQRSFIQHIVEEALQGEDLTDYDLNHDGYLDGIVVFAPDSYEPENARLPAYVDSYTSSVSNMKSAGFAFISQWYKDVYTVAHESIHLMGIPDIYDNVGCNLDGTHAETIMGEYTGAYANQYGIIHSNIPGIIKFFFGWIDNVVEVSSSGYYEVSSYSTAPELMVIYPNGETDSKFIFVAEYITKDNNDAVICEKNGFRIWRVLLNIDDQYEVVGNSSIIGCGNGPCEFLDAITDYGDNATFLLKTGDVWNDDTFPNSRYFTSVRLGTYYSEYYERTYDFAALPTEYLTSGITVSKIDTSEKVGRTLVSIGTENKFDISAADIECEGQFSNSSQIEENIEVLYKEFLLKKNTDYTVDIENETEDGIVTVTINGIGEFTGILTKDFTLQQQKEIIPTVELSALTFTYDGKEHKPEVYVKDGSTVLSLSDYDLTYEGESINVGTYKILITLKGNYTGTGEASFTIVPKNATPTVTLSTSAYTYNGKTRKPSVTVKIGSKKLTTADYSVKYASGRKNVGQYKVTVTLKGNYTGSKSVYFKINPKGTTLATSTPASKAITVKWKKQSAKMASSRISGYQIQLATNSKFTKNKKTVTVKGYSTTSKKVTKLKGKTKYYIRIRTYKTVGGKKYYSPWSKVKTVTTKK